MPRPSLNIDIAHKIASQKGGSCLSNIYLNNKQDLLWKCYYGHEWFSTLKRVKAVREWCPECGNKKKITLDTAKQIAIQKGGRCLSTEYINSVTHLKWQCKDLHTWYAKLNDVKNGRTWCPSCARVAKLTIEDAHNIAEQRGGQCLSTVYINNINNLIWRCKYGHTWSACMNKIRNKGKWCPDCPQSNKSIIDSAKQISTEQDSQCLSIEQDSQCLSIGNTNIEYDSQCLPIEHNDQHLPIEYINCFDALKWQCDQLHVWDVSSANMKNCNSWCPKCNMTGKCIIDELNNIAIKHGGKCLSTEYFNSQLCLEWICSSGHKWSTIPNSIIKGFWCPECNQLEGERAIETWLKENNVQYEYQYIFFGLEHSYNFYIPLTGWIIEFDGIKHLKPILPSNTREYQQEIDRQKMMHCYNIGLSMLHIHYLDIGSINELLSVILTKVSPHVTCSRTDDYEYLGLNFS